MLTLLMLFALLPSGIASEAETVENDVNQQSTIINSGSAVPGLGVDSSSISYEVTGLDGADVEEVIPRHPSNVLVGGSYSFDVNVPYGYLAIVSVNGEEVATIRTSESNTEDGVSTLSMDEGQSTQQTITRENVTGDENVVVMLALDDGIATYAMSVSSATIGVGESLTVTGTANPTGCTYEQSWSSRDSAVATVSGKGINATVTAVKEGSTTINHTYCRYDYNGRHYTTTENLTVTVEAAATSDDAQVYYLISPTADPDSNEQAVWGRNLGTGTVLMNGATWTNDKNAFGAAKYVTGMPTGITKTTDGWLLDKTTYAEDYTTIFNAYQSTIKAEFPDVTLSKDDITIYLLPYKVSKNNGTTPDKHIDCTVSVKCDKIFTAKFWVTMPDKSEKQVDAKNYLKGTNIEKTNKVGEGTTYHEQLVVGGVTYIFDGWYNENGEKIAESNWPYTPNDTELADGTVNFYAHYTEQKATIYYKAVTEEMGTVSTASETVDMKSGRLAGSTATAKFGYTFKGWYKDAECENPVDKSWVNGTTIVPEKSEEDVWVDGTTYYAKFEENNVVINYVPVTADMGDVSLSSETVGVFTGEPEGSTPTAKDTYKFVGWYTDVACTSPVDTSWVEANGKITPQKETLVEGQPAMGYKAATYYAKFVLNAVKVKVTKMVTGNFGDKSKEFQIYEGEKRILRLLHNHTAELQNVLVNTKITWREDCVGYTTTAVCMVNNEKFADATVTYNAEGNPVIEFDFTNNPLPGDAEITITNHKEAKPDTGVLLDSLPYILIIACVAGAAALFLIRRRKKRED